MAETDPKIMSMVESALKKNPDATVDELFTMAKSASRAVGRMSRRQFHARYPLQIKRRASGGAKKAKARKAATAKSSRKSTSGATRRKAAAAPAATKAVRRGRPRGSRNRPKASSAGGSGSGNGRRDGVRAAFLSFAADLTAAEGVHAEYGVIANVDTYVDAAMKAAR